MRGAIAVTLVLSAGAHLAVAAALLVARPPPDAPIDPLPQLAGETFELPAPETAEVPETAAPSPEATNAPSPEATSPPVPSAEGDEPARPSPPAQSKRAARPPRAARASTGRPEPGQDEGGSGTTGTTPALYGAVGERSAADLATAFTRGFPQAASADPAWRAARLGSAGAAVVVVTLDESGHIESTEIRGSPSAALTSAIQRTLALVKGRPFVAKGKVTKLHLDAAVSADAVHDGLHGDVFAIGGSFAGGEGSAFFALAIGRRIDVRVRLE